MVLQDKLKALRIEAGLSQIDTAEQLQVHGISVKSYTISNWESGKRTPSAAEFLALCDVYNVDDIREAITGKRSIEVGKSPFDGLNKQGIDNARSYIKFLKSNPTYTEDEEYTPRVFRLYDLPVSAGSGMYLDSSDYTEMTAHDLIPDEMDYAVRVSGDSMEPKYHDGQIIFIKEQAHLENGEIGIFALNNDAYLKKLVDDTLVSLNKKYKPILLQEHDDLRIFGKVIGTY